MDSVWVGLPLDSGGNPANADPPTLALPVPVNATESIPKVCTMQDATPTTTVWCMPARPQVAAVPPAAIQINVDHFPCSVPDDFFATALHVYRTCILPTNNGSMTDVPIQNPVGTVQMCLPAATDGQFGAKVVKLMVKMVPNIMLS